MNFKSLLIVTCLLFASLLWADTVSITHQEKLSSEIREQMFDEGVPLALINLFDTPNYIYRLELTGPAINYETAECLLEFGVTPEAFIGLLQGDEFEMASVGDSETTWHLFDYFDTWTDITANCQAADIYVQLEEDYITHYNPTLTVWIGFTSSLGSTLYYQELQTGGTTIAIEGYEVIPAYNRSTTIPYETITPAELLQHLTAENAEAYYSLFDQPFVYKLTLTEPMVSYGVMSGLLQLGQVPQAVIAMLDGGAVNETGSIGAVSDPYMLSFSLNVWQNVTSSCQEPNIFFNLGEDWIMHTPATMEVWIGTQTLLGNDLNYQEYSGDGLVLSIKGYEIEEPGAINLPIPYESITDTELGALLQSDNATAFTGTINQPWVYHISFHAPLVSYETTTLKLMFAQIAEAAIGRNNSSTIVPSAFGVVYIGTELGSYEFTFGASNLNNWENITSSCNDNNVFLEINEDYWLHMAANFEMWIGFSSSLGANLVYQDLSIGGANITIQGYQVTPGEDNTVPIPYSYISKTQLDNLLTTDGAGTFTGLFDQTFVYRIVLTSLSGYEENTQQIMAHFEQIPQAVIAYGYVSSGDMPMAAIGKEGNTNNVEENWQDQTTYCGAADIRMNVSPGWITHHPTTMYVWMGFSSSLGSTLAYDLLDSSDQPSHFSIQGYHIGEYIGHIIDFGYLPLRASRIDCLMINDNIIDHHGLPDLPYLLRLNLQSGSDIATAVKMKMELEKTPAAALGRGSGENNPQAAIGDAIDNQYNVDTQNWQDLTQVCNTSELFVILNDDPNTLEPGILDLWFGFSSPPGHTVGYENLPSFLLPDSFSVKSYRVNTKPEITQVSVSQPANYELAYLQQGDNYYLDRNYYLTGIPDSLENLIWLMPENDDKNNEDAEFLSLSIAYDATIYIAYDHRAASLPNWLAQNYEAIPWQIQVSDFSTPMNVYKKGISAGQVILGGNMAEGAAGAKSQYTVLIDLPHYMPPIADFNADVTTGPVPLDVQFSDLSGGDVVSWLWDFGDGDTSTEQNPQHTYDTVDTFTVSLTVTGPAGSDETIFDDYIIVKEQPPLADFNMDVTSGAVPLTVQFTDNSSGIIAEWYWAFGDETNSNQQNPSHIFAVADTYTVALTVKGPGGTSVMIKENCICAQIASGIAENSTIPTQFNLYQNYPNPFNPQTGIKYDVPQNQHINIAVYNIKGEKVATLVNEQQAPGQYNVTWNALDHATGIYFIRMTTAEFSKISKCLLIK